MKSRSVIYNVVSVWLCGILIIGLSASKPSLVRTTEQPLNENSTSTIFLPLVTWDYGVALGVYTHGYLGSQYTINTEVKSLDTWAAVTGGKRLSILGTFIQIEDPTTIVEQLEVPWENGYIVFVNMGSTHTSYEIANGSVDSLIKRWAAYYKIWLSKGGGRWAIIAPLQEMNGYWTPYGLNPTNFKLAYQRIQNIFKESGISDNSVRWAFAPNGYQDPGDPPFEDYYPGDQFVSIVAFSSYNFGLCPVAIKSTLNPQWQTAETIFSDYLSRMKKMAPNKPIYIAETGSTSYTKPNYPDQSTKNQWLIDTYLYLAKEGVKGILYLNFDSECDFAFYQPEGRQLDGYRQAVSAPYFDYFSPSELLRIIR